VATDISAIANHANGKIYPPSSTLVFDKLFKSQDNSLVELLASRECVAEEVARSHIKNFVEEIKSGLTSSKQVSLGGIGNFFLDSAGELVFDAPEFTAFNIENYGLPVLDYKPLAVSRKTEIQKHESVQMPKTKVDYKSSWFRPTALAYGLTAALLLFLLLAWSQVFDGSSREEPGMQIVPTAETRINVRPVTDNKDTSNQVNVGPESAIEEIGGPNQNEELAAPTSASGEAFKKLGHAGRGGGKTMILGTFSKRENIDRMVKRLEKSRFVVYTNKIGLLTRVGVTLPNVGKTESDEKLALLQQMFGTDIWELENNSK
jgi:hypothetical protein